MMRSMNARFSVLAQTLAVLAALSLGAVAAHAQEGAESGVSTSAQGQAAPHTPPPITPEMRQKMATMHEEMAKCLRSDKPIEECRQQMMQNCPMKGHCPMMGMGPGPGAGPGMGKMKGDCPCAKGGMKGDCPHGNCPMKHGKGKGKGPSPGPRFQTGSPQ